MELKGLKEIINKRNLKQREIAMKSGLSPEQLSRYLHGKQTPTYKSLEKIAEALKVKVDKII